MVLQFAVRKQRFGASRKRVRDSANGPKLPHGGDSGQAQLVRP